MIYKTKRLHFTHRVSNVQDFFYDVLKKWRLNFVRWEYSNYGRNDFIRQEYLNYGW